MKHITTVNYSERIAQATYADALAYYISSEQLIHCVDFLGGCSVDHPAVELLEQRFEKLLDDKAAERAARETARRAKRAIKKYGIEVCKEAYDLHVWGYGASGVSHCIAILNGNTRAADSAIDAGRWLAVNSNSNI